MRLGLHQRTYLRIAYLHLQEGRDTLRQTDTWTIWGVSFVPHRVPSGVSCAVPDTYAARRTVQSLVAKGLLEESAVTLRLTEHGVEVAQTIEPLRIEAPENAAWRTGGS